MQAVFVNIATINLKRHTTFAIKNKMNTNNYLGTEPPKNRVQENYDAFTGSYNQQQEYNNAVTAPPTYNGYATNNSNGTKDNIQEVYKKYSDAISSPTLSAIGRKVNNKIVKPMLVHFNDTDLQELEEMEKKRERLNKLQRGVIDIMHHFNTTRPIAEAYEKYMDNKIIREAGVPLKSLRHALAAWEIGGGIKELGTNLSSNAERFAKKYDEYYEGNKDKIQEKSYISEARNALRHTIWQGKLAAIYGPQVAMDAGDAHETRPYLDTDIIAYDNKEYADMAADLLNNQIGRRIGVMMRGCETKDIALKVLEEYYTNGLYSREMGRDGRWYVIKRNLPLDVYLEIFNLYKNSDEFGF